MRISNSEHPIALSNPSLISSASDILGKDEAACLLDALVASYDMSHDYLPVLSPIESVAVTMQENIANRPVEGRVLLKNSAMKLGINTTSNIDEIISELPNAFIHEAAHLTHLQRNPLFFVARREEMNLHFGSAIMEGVAAHTGSKLGAFTIYSEKMFTHQKVLDALSQLLDHPDANQYETYEQFMLGDKDFSNRGYRVGEFVVANLVKQMTLTSSELMDLPLDDFYEYAKTLR